MDETPSIAAAKPTQTPSWVMLGFVLGALFVLALPRHGAPGRPPAPAPAPPPLPPPSLTTIEDVFATWGKYAVWDNDTTEVAMWDSGRKAYADCFEVLRVADVFYFRSIPNLTRPLLEHGLPDNPNPPLEFTETQAQREEWLKAAHQTANWPVLNQVLGGRKGSTP
ncbi:MAG TPA: hypothetical protein VHV47_01705 [Opitutaceae bacterium]|jgi:hypothetical protein|nr:hypothetical protein [Opitutaceae bacterium]